MTLMILGTSQNESCTERVVEIRQCGLLGTIGIWKLIWILTTTETVGCTSEHCTSGKPDESAS